MKLHLNTFACLSPLSDGRARFALTRALLCVIAFFGLITSSAQTDQGLQFRRDIRPMLEKYCFDCHADGANKGNVAFDEFKSDREVLENRDLWWRALKNLRAGIMPPSKKPQPSSEEKQQIA